MVFIIVGTYDGQLMGFEGPLNDLKSIFAFQASNGSIKSLFNIKRYLSIGGYEELIKIYDLKKKKELISFEGHAGTITSFTGYENYLVSGADDGSIIVWKMKQWAQLHQFPIQDAAILDLNIHSSGKLMLSLTRNNKFQLWNLLTTKRIFQKKFNFNVHKIQFFNFNSKELQLILMLGDKKLFFFNCDDNQICHRILFENLLTDIKQFNEKILVSDEKGIIYVVIFDLSTNTHRILLTFQAYEQIRVKQMQICKVDELDVLFTISTNGEIKLWDCLNLINEQADVNLTETGEQFQPINLIKTLQRLTCLQVLNYSNEDDITDQKVEIQEQKLIDENVEVLKSNKKESQKIPTKNKNQKQKRQLEKQKKQRKEKSRHVEKQNKEFKNKKQTPQINKKIQKIRTKQKQQQKNNFQKNIVG